MEGMDGTPKRLTLLTLVASVVTLTDGPPDFRLLASIILNSLPYEGLDDTSSSTALSVPEHLSLNSLGQNSRGYVRVKLVVYDGSLYPNDLLHSENILGNTPLGQPKTWDTLCTGERNYHKRCKHHS
jgi:hypothetical protein